MTLWPGLPVRQIAYFVADVRAAALRHRDSFGSGPFYVADHIQLRACRYRGQAGVLDHSSAYGQWGDVMVEFVQQNNEGTSAFHDMYPQGSGREGMHHVAVFVPDIEDAIASHSARNHAVALYAEMASGFAFAMIDAVASLGHMIELYEPDAQLLDFYTMVRAAGDEFAPGEVLRTVTFD